MTFRSKMANWRDEVLLEGEFVLLPKKKGVHKVTLTRCGLFFNPVTNSSNKFEEKSLLISDIIGCHLLEQRANGSQTSSTSTDTNIDSNNKNRSNSRGSNDLSSDSETTTFLSAFRVPESTDPSLSGFFVIGYPFRKKVFSGKKVRHRVEFGFSSVPSINEGYGYDEHRRTAEKWTNVINCLCRDVSVSLYDVPTCVPPSRRKFLVLINPHSGPGKALTIFRNKVAPMMQEANFTYKEVVTEYAGHASDLMKEITLNEWHAVVIVSGDGLIFETINGLMSRDDWASSIQVPIGCLPGGSGNALCCSINYSAGEPIEDNIVLHSTFIFIKHRIVPMDLVMVHLPEKTIYSFLSITWGIVADIDFESEKYRRLGDTRFTVGALKRIFGLRTYKGKLSFLPVAEYVPKTSPESKIVLSKVRRFSLRSRSSSASTIASSSDSGSPRLISRRALSLDQNNYNEVQANRLHQRFSQELTNANSSQINQNGLSKASGGNRLSGCSVTSESSLDNSAQMNSATNSPISSKSTSSSRDISVNTLSKLEEDDIMNTTENKALTIDTKDLPQSIEKLSDDTSPSNPSPMEESPQHDNSHKALPRHDNRDLNVNSVSGKQRSSSCLAAPQRGNGDLTVLGENQEIEVEEEIYQGHKKDFEPVPTTLLPPLDEPVPDNWVTLEDEFVLVCAAYQTHLGPEMLFAPDAHFNDGFIHLMLIREGISRQALLNLFLSFGEGAQVHSPHVEYIKVLAMRLEPETSEGNLMIDGERFDPAPCQAQILPGLAKILAIK